MEKMSALAKSYAMIAMTLLFFFDESRTVLARPVLVDTPAIGTEVDMASVGSLRREVRQHPGDYQRHIQQEAQPMASEVSDLLATDKKHAKNTSGKTKEGGFYKTFGSDADGEKGYIKKSFSDGDHGYKSLNTFHKKHGDRYGFEEHEAFGQGSESDNAKTKHQKHAKSGSQKRKKSEDHEGAGTDVESHYVDDGDYSGYSGGGGGGSGEYYSGGNDGGDTSSYNDGSSEGYSESYSSGDSGDGSGSAESYSSDDSSGEDGSYY